MRYSRDDGPTNDGPRVNRSIRISPVRVVMDDGTQLGVIPTRDALRKAENLGLDLVEVSPTARPPVCKIMDFGKWKYEQSKKQKEAKKNQVKVQLKQVKFRPKTDQHDLEFKIRNIRKFIEAGNKVQLEVVFKGRENAHPDEGRAVLGFVLEELADAIKVDSQPVYENKSMIALISPK